ncbi:hypothetical protein WJX77_001866 [Trebouxia sp. C0004]
MRISEGASGSCLPSLGKYLVMQLLLQVHAGLAVPQRLGSAAKLRAQATALNKPSLLAGSNRHRPVHLTKQHRAGVAYASSMQREKPGPGQESVWDYPRPPALQPVPERITVELGGKVIADTTGAYRVLETSHPPTYYIPPKDVDMQQLKPSSGSSYCEWKGSASYYDAPGKPKIAWYYAQPSSSFKPIAKYICFYPSKIDKATVGGEVVKAQPGDFYGGWITSKLVGPFKGSPGTLGW